MLERDAVGAERGDELEHAVERRVERRALEDLRADMAADAGHAQVRASRRLAIGRECVLMRNAELAGGEPRRDVRMGKRVDVGIHAQRHRGDPPHRSRDRVEALDLGLALDVEAADAGAECRAHLGLRFADAGEDHPLGRPARGEAARELASRHDVEARAQPPQHVEHGEVGVRLYRVAHHVVHAREALVELAEGRFDHAPRVDVAGSAEARRDRRERHAVEGELARHALEPAHDAVSAGGLAGSGSLSGPFWPHAASATSTAAVRSARIMARIMTESEFHRAVDAVLARIESAAEADERLDVELESGILTIVCADATRVIVNRQTPNREIWVAARSGGFHFRFGDGAWRDTRTGEELFAAIARVVESQSGAHLAFE